MRQPAHSKKRDLKRSESPRAFAGISAITHRMTHGQEELGAEEKDRAFPIDNPRDQFAASRSCFLNVGGLI